MSKKHNPFPKFERRVCGGDTVQFTDKAGITFIARIVSDDDTTPPDERQDGFWPSLDPEDAGFVGTTGSSAKDERRLAVAKDQANVILAAWKREDWWYGGVCVTAHKAGVQLTPDYAHALWGVEVNYPEPRGRRPNRYLRQVAQELLDECRLAAADKLLELRS